MRSSFWAVRFRAASDRAAAALRGLLRPVGEPDPWESRRGAILEGMTRNPAHRCRRRPNAPDLDHRAACGCQSHGWPADYRPRHAAEADDRATAIIPRIMTVQRVDVKPAGPVDWTTPTIPLQVDVTVGSYGTPIRWGL
ncbi:MAG: hypothetical protein ACRDU4_01185 [Mycobacterium sp.]